MLDSVLAGTSHPVHQLGTATHARYGCPEQVAAHAPGCPV
jgi:hypothetical protein